MAKNTEFDRFRTENAAKRTNVVYQLYFNKFRNEDAAKQSNIMKKPIPKTSKTAERCLKNYRFSRFCEISQNFEISRTYMVLTLNMCKKHSFLTGSVVC